MFCKINSFYHGPVAWLDLRVKPSSTAEFVHQVELAPRDCVMALLNDLPYCAGCARPFEDSELAHLDENDCLYCEKCWGKIAAPR